MTPKYCNYNLVNFLSKKNTINELKIDISEKDKIENSPNTCPVV